MRAIVSICNTDTYRPGCGIFLSQTPEPWFQDPAVCAAHPVFSLPHIFGVHHAAFSSLAWTAIDREWLPIGAGRELGKKVFHLDTKMPIRRQICHSREEKHEAMHHQSGRSLLHSPVPQHLRRCGRRDGPVSIRYKNQRPTRLDSGKMGICSQTGSRQYACRRPGVARQCRLTLPKVS